MKKRNIILTETQLRMLVEQETIYNDTTDNRYRSPYRRATLPSSKTTYLKSTPENEIRYEEPKQKQQQKTTPKQQPLSEYGDEVSEHRLTDKIYKKPIQSVTPIKNTVQTQQPQNNSQKPKSLGEDENEYIDIKFNKDRIPIAEKEFQEGLNFIQKNKDRIINQMCSTHTMETSTLPPQYEDFFTVVVAFGHNQTVDEYYSDLEDWYRN